MILISIGQGNKARITGSTRGGHGQLLPRHDGQRQYAGQLQKERSLHDSVVVDSCLSTELALSLYDSSLVFPFMTNHFAKVLSSMTRVQMYTKNSIPVPV